MRQIPSLVVAAFLSAALFAGCGSAAIQPAGVAGLPATEQPTEQASPTAGVTAAVTTTPTGATTQTPTPDPTPEPTPKPKSRPTPKPGPAVPTGAITAAKAGSKIGTRATVCGIVVSPSYNGGPTFLNLDKSYPNQIFTIVIWPEDRWRYPKPPQNFFDGKLTCVKGVVESYGGVPQIVARSNVAFRP